MVPAQSLLDSDIRWSGGHRAVGVGQRLQGETFSCAESVGLWRSSPARSVRRDPELVVIPRAYLILGRCANSLLHGFLGVSCSHLRSVPGGCLPDLVAALFPISTSTKDCRASSLGSSAVGFRRCCSIQPRFVVLDGPQRTGFTPKSTSYPCSPSGRSLVSVGHRPQLAAFHDTRFELGMQRACADPCVAMTSPTPLNLMDAPESKRKTAQGSRQRSSACPRGAAFVELLTAER